MNKEREAFEAYLDMDEGVRRFGMEIKKEWADDAWHLWKQACKWQRDMDSEIVRNHSYTGFLISDSILNQRGEE